MNLQDLYSPTPLPALRIGQHLQSVSHGVCIVAQTSAKKVALIGLKDGNRFRDPVEVWSVTRINRVEAHQLAGDLEKWELVPNAQVNP